MDDTIRGGVGWVLSEDKDARARQAMALIGAAGGVSLAWITSRKPQKELPVKQASLSPQPDYIEKLIYQLAQSAAEP